MGVAVGIDLGTTNSVISVVRNGRLEVIPDAQGHRLHPSVVSFKPSGERVVGLPARLRRIIDPTNTVYSAKRIIGQSFRSERVQRAIAQVPYKVEEGENEEPVIVTRQGRFPVWEISGMVLGYLREIAEKHLGQAVRECVVTVPANFNDGQREATRRAAEAAGMTPLRILNEPTAASLAYGQGKQVHQRVAVFDLGGGTFDMTLLAIHEGLYEVLATGGDPFLGGDDMDREVAELLAREFLSRHRVDLRLYPDAWAKLTIAGEQIKAQLSSETQVSGTIKELAHGEGGIPLALTFEVTRAHLDELIAPLVDRAVVKCEDVLVEAGVMPQHVDEVILVGGATRVPLVRARVADQFGRSPRTDINPMEVVSAGAALHAASLVGELATAAGSTGDGIAPLLMDVTPHALGIQTAGGYTDVLVQKNAQIPTERTRLFTTARDGQTEVVIKVCQGADKQFAQNSLLGELRLHGLPAAPRGKQQIEVSFLVDADGVLQVSAKDVVTGRAERATLKVVGVGGRP